MKNFTKILLLCFTVTAGILLFQAQDFMVRQYDENDPYIDRPTSEAHSHINSMLLDGQQDIITDADGYDNFEIGVDFAEQHATQNPNNPLQLFVSANGSGAPQNAYWTTNGGLNWTLNNPSYPGGTCCDPWSAYLNNGTLIYGSGVSNQYVYLSTNNGQTFTAPIFSVSGNDRNTLAAEETGTGPFANYVYAAITPGNFSRSTDNGQTWTQTYTSSNTVPGTMIAVGPNGTTNGGCVIYVTNTGSTQAVNYTFHRSTNGGASGSFTVASSLNVAGYVGTLNSVTRLVINNARTRPYPMIAMDNSNGPFRGRLYLVYASNDPAGNGNKPDIFLQYSTDQGSTWSTKIRVNDNSNPTQSDQWFPAIWCERTTGTLYIKWYDTRENPATYQTGVWGTYSTTGGVTFAANQRISNASWTYPCPACGPNQNCYRGDYDGMTANTQVGYAVWYDPRGCTYQTMGSYFPDYAMKVQPTSHGMGNINDSDFSFISVPSVKLYNRTVKFTASISPTPAAGTVSLNFLNKSNNNLLDSLATLPDSLRLRIRATGGVTPGIYTVTVTGRGPNGTPVHQRTISVNIGFVGLINNNNGTPDRFTLYQNYPNPFNPVTNIKFDIAKSGLVKLTIFDVTGKVVSSLVNQELSPGSYSYDFDGANLSSGIYFYKIETPLFTSIRKMMLVK